MDMHTKNSLKIIYCQCLLNDVKCKKTLNQKVINNAINIQTISPEYTVAHNLSQGFSQICSA